MITNRTRAQRSPEKSIRVATHVPVLKMCFDYLNTPTDVVEHGMGLASTNFFHNEKNVKKIVSFEDDVRWQFCQACENKSSHQMHKIVSYNENFKITIFDNIDIKNCISLVDGPHLQRIKFINFLQEIGVPFIIEHDSESLPQDEFVDRVNMSKKYDYSIFEYYALNPETILYTNSSISNNDLHRINFETFTQ